MAIERRNISTAESRLSIGKKQACWPQKIKNRFFVLVLSPWVMVE